MKKISLFLSGFLCCFILLGAMTVSPAEASTTALQKFKLFLNHNTESKNLTILFYGGKKYLALDSSTEALLNTHVFFDEKKKTCTMENLSSFQYGYNGEMVEISGIWNRYNNNELPYRFYMSAGSTESIFPTIIKKSGADYLNIFTSNYNLFENGHAIYIPKEDFISKLVPLLPEVIKSNEDVIKNNRSTMD